MENVTSKLIDVHELFESADAEMDRRYPKKDYVTKKCIVHVPVPQIQGVPGVSGPLHVTQKWYDQEKTKQAELRIADVHECEIHMVQLLAKRDYLKIKLSALDPGDKDDVKDISNLNIRIREIDTELKQLEMVSGIRIDALDHGTRVGRFLNRCKKRVKKVVRRVKKFCKRNSDILSLVAAFMVPVVSSVITKLIMRW